MQMAFFVTAYQLSGFQYFEDRILHLVHQLKNDQSTCWPRENQFFRLQLQPDSRTEIKKIVF